MENRESEIIHIPEKPSFLPHLQPTVNVVAADIEPKDANILVRKLNKIAPLGNLRHVKRLRKKCIDAGKPQLSLLLSMAVENNGEVDCLPYEILELVKSDQLSIFITKVCKYAATSKEEWDEQCKLCPTSYHPPTYNISGITGYSEEESQSVFGFMRHTIDLATSFVGQIKESDFQSNGHSSESLRPYLCTGCDIYLAWEPCAMCAMALVHQRVRRIFFSFPNSNAGALGSVHRLQGERSLNHHYAVFRVVLPELLRNKVMDAKTAGSG